MGNIDSHLQECPIEAASRVIGGKWKVVIVHQLLNHQTLRFGALHRLMPGVSLKVLTAQLRQLEADDIIQREVFREVPPHVEYSLTQLGHSLKRVITPMKEWGADYVEKHELNKLL